MGKTIIRLTESELHEIVRDSVYQILEQKQAINEGWKNWAMAGALGTASVFGNPQTANAQNPIVDALNAQNPIVDALKDSNEVVRDKRVSLLLDPNKSIKDNYAKIDSMVSLSKESQYEKYTIAIKGHYEYKSYHITETYDCFVGEVVIERDNYDKDFRNLSNLRRDFAERERDERQRTINHQIIEALTALYSHSLGKRFDVDYKDYVWQSIGEHLTPFYSLRKGSSLYMRIYGKVMQEMGLQDRVYYYRRFFMKPAYLSSK